MARKSRDVTDAQLAILQVLWEHGTRTIRQVTDELYPGGAESEYATVKKLLGRMEEKALVARDASQMKHTFTAAINQGDLLERRLSNVADELCAGQSIPLVMSLLKNKKYTASERRQLRELFDELFDKKRKQ